MNPHHLASKVMKLSFLLLNYFLQMNPHDCNQSRRGCDRLMGGNLSHPQQHHSSPSNGYYRYSCLNVVIPIRILVRHHFPFLNITDMELLPWNLQAVLDPK